MTHPGGTSQDVQGAAVAALLRAEHAWRVGDERAPSLIAAAEAAVADAADAGLETDLRDLESAVQGA